MTYERKRDDLLGEWRLLEPLGEGGNAEVWLATCGDKETVALKILRARKPDSERYRRFVAEIAVLSALGQHPGLLPLLDHSLPERPTKEAPAWLAMPRAVPIRQALGPQPSLLRVVEAVATIADTLASLADAGIHHRDLKPENLYAHNDQWSVGDFGLVEYPDKEAITAPGRHIGPLHYLAPELLNDPNASTGPTDVYSLSKTLWVLATGQAFPLPGHLATEVAPCLISSYRPDPRVRAIERLLSRATQTDPAARPTMKELATELRHWLSPPASQAVDVAIEEVRSRILPLVDRQLRAEIRRNQHVEHVRKLLEGVGVALAPIALAMHRTTGLTTGGPNALSAFSAWRPIVELDHMAGLSFSRHACVHITIPLVVQGKASQLQLMSGVALAATHAERTHMIGAHLLGDGYKPQVVWSEVREAATESATEAHCLAELERRLVETIAMALDTLAERLDQ